MPNSQSKQAATSDMAAAVDLGSNSFHMIVARVDGGGLEVIDRLRERVRLAAGLGADGKLDPEASDRALACLERFGQRIAHMPADRVRVVGTNTLRKARDGRTFMAQALLALGHNVEVISGREEARLIYLGVAQSRAGRDKRRLVLDIGGGSTELIAGTGFEIHRADSMFMGCVSYSERYFPKGEISRDHFREAQMAAGLELQAISPQYQLLEDGLGALEDEPWLLEDAAGPTEEGSELIEAKRGWDEVVGCSGTIQAVRSVLEANQFCEPGLVTARGLRRMRKALIAAGHIDKISLDGLDDDRKSVISGGLAILLAIFEQLKLDELTTSSAALREGLLYDLVGRIQDEDVRERTILKFQRRYRIDVHQANRVEATAVALFEDAAESWKLPPHAAHLLSWASRLYEVGLAIAHPGHHRHSAYLLHHSHMAGFGRDEQRALAAIVGSHRRKIREDFLVDCDRTDHRWLTRIAALFRLAVKLNRGREGGPPPFRLVVKRSDLMVTFPRTWLEEHPLTNTVLDQEAEFLSAINMNLTVEVSDALTSEARTSARPSSD